MSDSDDTDFLLLIPPNFFVLSSPECLSPSYYFPCVEENFTNSVPSTVDSFYPLKPTDMESKASPLPNKVNNKLFSNSYTLGVEGNKDISSLNALSLSPLSKVNRSKTSICNTWPTKSTEFMDIREDTKHSSGANEVAVISPNKSSQDSKFSKFNLSQVDQLLIEMEKTRTEIKNKLLSNKNKIHEMRRECIGKNVNGNIIQGTNGFRTRSETVRCFETSKPMVDFVGEDKNTSENPTNSTRSRLNFDVNFPLPGGSKSMLQLSQIMSTENNADTLQQKLEAEILKKKHCEEIIQELQLKLLEQQQNLNVAQKIDAEKEEIIKQLQNAWLQLVEHWKELEHQRQELAHMLEQERTGTRNLNLNLNQKIETLENRLHETISLASSYRGKNEELEKSLKQMQESIVEFEDNFKKSEEYARLIELEKSNILEQFRQTNEILTSEKQRSLLLETKIADFENQISALITEKNNLAGALREERSTVSDLKNEITKLKDDYNRMSNAESLAAQQMNTMKLEILKAKNNLKEFYQNQLDILLRKKIEDFQKEFQKAQTIMRQEVHEQERLAEQRFQSELKQLKETHKIELSEERRVNQKHVNILKTELRESRKKIYELENRLKSDSSPKAELPKRVQSVLKNQWLDALNLISENDDLSKDFLSLNHNEKNDNEIRRQNNEDESTDEMISNKSHKTPFDLRNYISRLLEKEPGNPVDDYRSLELLLSGHRAESFDKKSPNVAKTSDNFRRKPPPWR